MKVRDDRAWAEQLTEFQADETSAKFGKFLEEWASELERLYLQVDDTGYRKLHPRTALSKSLEVAEQTMGRFLSVEWISQMLLVICDHWVHGDDLFKAMSAIEQRLVQQAATMKLAELQATASISTEE